MQYWDFCSVMRAVHVLLPTSGLLNAMTGTACNAVHKLHHVDPRNMAMSDPRSAPTAQESLVLD